MKKISVIPVMLSTVLSAGCMTVGLDSEFIERTEGFRTDGSLESVTETRWTQNAKGGPFSDIQEMKQDTSYIYQGPAGEYYEIGQGSGATGISGSGQVDALSSALQALSSAFNILYTVSGLPAPRPATP